MIPLDYLDPRLPTFVASAPGRLDVMGGIADYSGSLVLQLPLDRRTTVTAQRQPGLTVDIITLRDGEPHRRIAYDLRSLLDKPAHELALEFAPGSDDHWAAYVLGAAHACLVRHGVPAASGITLVIESTVPEGKGVSSSAALEVSAFAAIAAAYDVSFTPQQIATECQWAENHIAGAPCGIMDQMTSACGERDQLLRLRCQPATIEGYVAIPEGFRFYGIDSGIRHAVTGADYSTVRTAAFMGYRLIAELAGLKVDRVGDRLLIDDPQWNGYLANISPAEFTDRFEHHLPDQLLGADFLARYHGITDTVTRVNPDLWYPIRAATAHPISENTRVERFASMLGELPHWSRELGALMYASHESYSACGLGSDGTDRLVAMVRESPGDLFGAKITGGGSGGTVAILGTSHAGHAVRDIAQRYEAETGQAAEVFEGSGDGLLRGTHPA
ncbi:MAG: galK 2 [Gemmatimonadetes bacterium]|nr:galK 2 [Gemmatimonadota bacterium]